MTDRAEHLWRVDRDTFDEFVRIHDSVASHIIEEPEAVDRLRSLPNFPQAWSLGDAIRILIIQSPKVTVGPRGGSGGLRP